MGMLLWALPTPKHGRAELCQGGAAMQVLGRHVALGTARSTGCSTGQGSWHDTGQGTGHSTWYGTGQGTDWARHRARHQLSVPAAALRTALGAALYAPPGTALVGIRSVVRQTCCAGLLRGSCVHPSGVRLPMHAAPERLLGLTSISFIQRGGGMIIT